MEIRDNTFNRRKFIKVLAPITTTVTGLRIIPIHNSLKEGVHITGSKDGFMYVNTNPIITVRLNG